MGKVTVSLDFEIGWGSIESQLWQHFQSGGVYTALRPAMQRLTGLLDDLEIELTWATVGAMIDNPTQSSFDHLAPNLRDAAILFLRNAKPSTSDGRDLFDMVQNMKTKQDIGSHTYSHTRFGHQDFDDAAKAADLRKSVDVLKAHGVTPQSFVFPLNQARDFDIVDAAGFRVARLSAIEPTSKVMRILNRSTGHTNSAQRRRFSNKLDTETGSMLFNWTTLKSAPVRRYIGRSQVRKGLKLASESDHHLHMWLHPFNIAAVRHLEDDLHDALKKSAKLRDAGKLEIVPISPL